MKRSLLCLLGVTLATLAGCARPANPSWSSRAAIHQTSLEANGQISRGACDDAGQFIPVAGARSATLEASAAPSR